MDSIFVAMTANLNSSKVRRVMRGGKEYLVASGSSINPGVLAGSKGPLYYPAEEASRNASAWDGMPIVVYHPVTPDGRHVSANHPGIRERQQIGFLDNSSFDGKLRHEHWFEADKLRSVKDGDPFAAAKRDIYNRLMRNRPIETSTGLYTDNEPTPGSCPKTGRHYDAVARNYRPDHLAVLPDQIGACSVSDGCGVLVNANPEGHNQYSHLVSIGHTMSKKDYVSAQTALPGQSGMARYHGMMHKNIVAAALAADKIPLAKAKKMYKDIDEHPQAGKYRTKAPGHPAGEIESNSAEKSTMDNLSFLQKILGVLTGTNYSDRSVVANEKKCKECGLPMSECDCDDEETRNADQPRHPREGTYQGKAGNSAKAGYSDLDAKRQQVGSERQEAGTSGRDGRNVDLTKRVADTFQHHDGKGGGEDDSDSDDDGQLVDSPELKVKADKKVGSQSQQVSVNESFEEGDTSPMYVGDQQSAPAHVASKQAAAASVGTEHGEARDAALGAVDASKGDDHDAAEQGHVGAAKLHEKAAVGALKDKDAIGADDHMRAAALHRKAAMLHSATKNEENMRTATTNELPAEQLAAWKMKEDGRYDEPSGDHGKETTGAMKASEHANKTGTKGAHQKAASAHREAAEHHRGEGNADMAKGHSNMAKSHTQKANRATNNQLIPASVIANCGCEETRQRLLQLNAKAEGSNADVSGSGEVQAGDEEDADDHDYDSDDSGFPAKAESAVKGKKGMKMNMQQFEATMPPEAREVWNAAKQATQQAKAGLARQLVANIGDTEQRQQRFRHYMGKSPTELRELVADLGVAYNRQEEAVENDLEPLYLGAAAPVGNGSYGSQPDVDDVIPVRNCIGDIVREAAEARV